LGGDKAAGGPKEATWSYSPSRWRGTRKKAGKGARDAVEVGGGVGRPDLVEGDGDGGPLAVGQGRDVKIADCRGDREVGVVGGPDEAAGVLEIA